MKIAIVRERADGETRVAATPDSIKKLIGLGATVSVEKGAGEGSRIPDAEFELAGAKLVATPAATLKDADVVLAVRRPDASSLKGVSKGAMVLAVMDPFGNEKALDGLAKAGLLSFGMEFMPRITRAQVMDVLSSQANLAGYQAVIDAAAVFDRALPMMMTAAGTVRAAKVFVMGAGVAGLQAIATARRLGAAVSATDVRAVAGEQVESLGAKFIMTEALKDASGSGGYARELTPEEQAAQAELVAGHIAKQDIVITTALIPGRPAPRLVSKTMVETMAPGSVIVDMAAERGGNVEGTKPGEVVVHKDVTIIGTLNLAGKIAATASQLYAKNLLAFLETMIDAEKKALAINFEDELVKATLLTRDGAIIHEGLAEALKTSAPAKKPAAKSAKPATTPKAAKPAAKPAAKAPAKTGAASKTASKPAATKSGTAKSGARKPAAAKATATGTKTTAAKPAAAKTAASKPAGKKPAAKKTAAKKDGDQ